MVSASEIPSSFPCSLLGLEQHLCSILGSECNDTSDPDVSAAEMQFRRIIGEDASWRPDDSSRTQSLTCPTCASHTLLTPWWANPPKSTGFSLNYTRSPGLEFCCWEDPTHVSSTGTPTLFALPVVHRLRIDLVDQDSQCPKKDRSSIAFAITPLSAHVRDRNLRLFAIAHVFHEATQEAGLHPQKEKAGLLQPRPKSDSLPHRASHDRPADVWIPHWERHDS